MSLVFCTLEIGAFGRVHDNARTGFNMRRNENANAIIKNGRLEGRRLGLPFDNRVGFDDLADNMFGQGHGKRFAFEGFDGDNHAILKEYSRFADEFCIDCDLFESFAVHEGDHVTIGKQIGIFILFQTNTFDGFRRTETFVQLGAGTNVFEFNLDLNATSVKSKTFRYR